MARKMMTKEVTKTTVTLAKMEMKDGKIETVQLPNEILIGNVTLEKAQKEMNKKHDDRVTVLTVQPDTKVYELEVEKFIEVATEKVQSKEENTQPQK